MGINGIDAISLYYRNIGGKWTEFAAEELS